MAFNAMQRCQRGFLHLQVGSRISRLAFHRTVQMDTYDRIHLELKLATYNGDVKHLKNMAVHHPDAFYRELEVLVVLVHLFYAARVYKSPECLASQENCIRQALMTIQPPIGSLYLMAVLSFASDSTPAPQAALPQFRSHFLCRLAASAFKFSKGAFYDKMY